MSWRALLRKSIAPALFVFAVVGGLTLGVLLNLLGAYVDFVGSELRLPTALLVLLAVLLIRPQGLFGHAVVRRV